MLPKPPLRTPQVGFLYLPPLRVQGFSIAGEESVVQIPELDLCFDIGRCPRLALTSRTVALSHGHMDHSAGLAYYFSQRYFQGMDVGSVVCHPQLEMPIHKLMRAWVDVESQRTPYKVLPLAPDAEFKLRKNVYLRAFATSHTVVSLGFIVLERRNKLRSDLVGLPQEKLVQLKQAGEQITTMLDVPLICYTGDTAMGDHFDRGDVLGAKILIIECTFMEPSHRDRALVGKHLHLDDIIQLMDRSTAETIVLTHVSRRTHMGAARQHLNEAIPPQHRDRVFLLMDSKSNRLRYDQQQRNDDKNAEAEAGE